MAPADLRNVRSHFAFGENWSEYANKINDTRIQEAEEGLLRLIPAEDLRGKSVLDIGCGSGLHSLAALRLGAAEVILTDIDPASVATGEAVLRRYAPQESRWIARQESVFDMTPQSDGLHDIVYSWGVLHHTGAMHEALRNAAALVKPGGLFAFALYRRTRLCGFWAREKRWYAQASPRSQKVARGIYASLAQLAFLVTGRSFRAYRENYNAARGMDYWHDVHDWLGGYPYESVRPHEVNAVMQRLGFTPVRAFTRPYSVGLLGTGCDEFVYRRVSA